jgi:AAA domain
MKFARSLAHEAVINKNQADQLWEICDEASAAAPGYDQEDNRRRFRRYMAEAFDQENPITILTIFHMALEQGWQGRSPPTLLGASQPIVWSASELKVTFGNIPHRRWLYDTYLIRGEITVLAAPGGAGKTALATGIAIEVATGIEVLAKKIYKDRDLSVLFINGEDSSVEIVRRIRAFCLAHAYKLGSQSLDRLLVLGADNSKVHSLSFLKTDKTVSTVDVSGFDALRGALEILRPDLVVLDPLVAFCGGGNMNDNSAMAQVLRRLKTLASEYDCAMLIVHHTKKGGESGDQEAILGAAAIVNLARRAIMPMPITGEEALTLGSLPSERYRFFKVADAKSNLAPRAVDCPLYKLHSVDLLNAEPPIYPYGDNVQAVERIDPQLPKIPAVLADEQKIQRVILDLIKRGKMIDGKSYPYSVSSAGASNERAILDDAKAAIVAATAPRQWQPDDLKAVIQNTLKKMKSDGWIVEKELKELMEEPDRFRRGRGLAIDMECPPHPQQIDKDLDAEETLHGGQLVNAPVDD